MATRITRRDPDGKIAPKFGRAWTKAQERKQKAQEQRAAELKAQNSAWAKRMGIDPDELQYLFA